MRLARRAAKRDTAEATVIAALRKAGALVYTELPCDALVYVPGDRFAGNPNAWPHWRTLEIKTPTKSGKRRKRKDQPAQDSFLSETGTPVVCTPEEALRALGLLA